MYLLLFLFFGALLGILFMIGRKLALLDAHQEKKEDLLLDIPYIEEWKDLSAKSIKRITYESVVFVIRVYVKSSNFLKNKYKKIKEFTAKKMSKKITDKDKREISKFLKTISDYKRKAREIKHRIVEEEKNLKIE
jgi:endo-1,4-beta-mannosidase